LEKDGSCRNPKEDPALVQKKQEITDWLEAHWGEIASGKLVVFFQDQCHLLWGDLCGYVGAAAIGVKLLERVLGGIIPPKISDPETCLGKTNERIEVPIVNERSKQTYAWRG